MIRHLPIKIGLRYAGLKNTQGFAAVISYVAMAAMVLGISSLIIVLSVMNGFRSEFRDRLLQVVPHVLVEMPYQAWLDAGIDSQHVEIDAVAPYVEGAVLVRGYGRDFGAILVGIDYSLEKAVTSEALADQLSGVEQSKFSAVLGAGVARRLGVGVGDRFSIVLPRVTVTPAGVFPRTKTVTVAGIFSVGAQVDGSHIYMQLASAQRLLGANAIEQTRLKIADVESAPMVTAGFSTSGIDSQSWRDSHSTLFDAMAMEKIVVGVMLTAIILVAAFNITSLLAMAVAQKRGSIAVLRMMGASEPDVVRIFFVQGLAVSAVGIILGACLGFVGALYVGEIVAWFEQLFGVQMFDASLYYVSTLPSVIFVSDIVKVVVFSVLVAAAAGYFPSRRAAQIAPAEALRYE